MLNTLPSTWISTSYVQNKCIIPRHATAVSPSTGMHGTMKSTHRVNNLNSHHWNFRTTGLSSCHVTLLVFAEIPLWNLHYGNRHNDEIWYHNQKIYQWIDEICISHSNTYPDRSPLMIWKTTPFPRKPIRWNNYIFIIYDKHRKSRVSFAVALPIPMGSLHSNWKRWFDIQEACSPSNSVDLNIDSGHIGELPGNADHPEEGSSGRTNTNPVKVWITRIRQIHTRSWKWVDFIYA